MMRVLVAMVAMTLSLAATPAEAADYGPQAPDTRFLIRELDAAPEASGSDVEKLRTARYGLNDPDEDDYERVPDQTRLRWKLNRFKVRVPLRFQ